MITSYRLTTGEIVDVAFTAQAIRNVRAFYDRGSGHVMLMGTGRADLSDKLVAEVATRIKHEAVHAHWRGLPVGVRNRNALRALTVPTSDGRAAALLVNNLGARSLEGLRHATGGEVWHEIVHVYRRNEILVGDVWGRLLRHARRLRILDRNFRETMRIVGDPTPEAAPDRSIRDVYNMHYANRANRADLLQEEAVSHMLELWHHGAITDEDIAPIRDIIDDMASGKIAGNEASETSEYPDAALAARRRALDFITKQIAAGKSVPISPDVVRAFLDAAQPHLGLLPDGSTIRTLTHIRPVDATTKARSPWATMITSYRLTTGEIVDVPFMAQAIRNVRAFYDRASGHVMLMGTGRSDLSDKLVAEVATRIKHEAVHARWRSLSVGVRNRLASHAHLLGVLEMQFGTLLQIIGEPSVKNDRSQRSLRDL